MFTQKEQDEIINGFLDVIKVSNYIRESREKRDKCKCKDCKKHEHYCTLNEMPLPKILLLLIMALLISAMTAIGQYTS